MITPLQLEELAKLKSELSYKEPTVSVVEPSDFGGTNKYALKTHLSHGVSTYCSSGLLLHIVGYEGREWINQGDPDSQLCKRCKKGALKYLDSIDMDKWKKDRKEMEERVAYLQSLWDSSEPK